MCTSIIEIARAEGMAKRGAEWFPLSQAVVAYDHARHAPLGDVITLDFINTGLDPGARAGIELTLETAKELRAALDRAIAAAEFEEAEVRGKGSTVASLVRAACHPLPARVGKAAGANTRCRGRLRRSGKTRRSCRASSAQPHARSPARGSARDLRCRRCQ